MKSTSTENDHRSPEEKRSDRELLEKEIDKANERLHTYEDWNILTRGNRTNHFQAEIIIWGQRNRAERGLRDDS